MQHATKWRAHFKQYLQNNTWLFKIDSWLFTLGWCPSIKSHWSLKFIIYTTPNHQQLLTLTRSSFPLQKHNTTLRKTQTKHVVIWPLRPHSILIRSTVHSPTQAEFHSSLCWRTVCIPIFTDTRLLNQTCICIWNKLNGLLKTVFL